MRFNQPVPLIEIARLIDAQIIGEKDGVASQYVYVYVLLVQDYVLLAGEITCWWV